MLYDEPLHSLPDAGAAAAGIKMPNEKEIRRKERATEPDGMSLNTENKQ